MEETNLNHSYLSTSLQKELMKRLANIEGHTRGIRRMLVNHEDCDRILVQLAAIKAAVNQVSMKLLEGHIEYCVKDIIRDEGAQKIIDSLISAVMSGLKK